MQLSPAPLMSLALVVLSAVLTCSSAAKADEFPLPDCVKAPTPADALGTLKKGHPRLFVSNGDFDRVARLAKNDEFCKWWYKNIADYADEVIDQPVSKYEIPDGRRLLKTSRRVLQRVAALSLVNHISPDQKYVDRVWAELEAAGNFKDWNPSHFLDVGEMALAFAIAYDWLYDSWTPEQRHFIERAIIDKALTYTLEMGYGNHHIWFAHSSHNWNQVCNGGLLAGALAIAEADMDKASRIVSESVKSLPRAMTQYSPDGAWDEGPMYWSYGTSFNVVALEVLRSALGSDFGLAKIDGFDKAALFPVYMTSPIQRSFNFSDCSSHSVKSVALLWFAREFNQPLAADYFRRVMNSNSDRSYFAGRLGPLGLLWYDPQMTMKDGQKWLNNFKFAGVECASLCENQYDTNAMYLAFKGGRPSVNHGNCDVGTFIFDADGVRWAEDLGSDNYNMPGYFDGKRGGKRWTYYRMRGEGHNTLVFNPAGGEDQDIDAISKIVYFDDDNDHPSGVVDMTPTYKPYGIAQVMRSYELLCDGSAKRCAIVSDRIVPEKQSEIWWFMHTKAEVTIAADGQSAALTLDGKKLTVELDCSADASFELMAARPLPTSPDPDMDKTNDEYRKLAIHLQNVDQPVTITVTLTPTH